MISNIFHAAVNAEITVLFHSGISFTTAVLLCYSVSLMFSDKLRTSTHLWHWTETFSSSARMRKTRMRDARLPVRPLLTTKFLHTFTVASSNIPWSTLDDTNRSTHSDSPINTEEYTHAVTINLKITYDYKNDQWFTIYNVCLKPKIKLNDMPSFF